MRNFINIVENISPMTRDDYNQGNGSHLTILPGSSEPERQGDHREDMTVSQAHQYLDEFPDGTLHCEAYNTTLNQDSFVTKDRNGNYLFYDSTTDRVEPWDWDKDIKAMLSYDQSDTSILTGWWYHPGQEMSETRGGINWWDEVRSGQYSSPAPHRLK